MNASLVAQALGGRRSGRGWLCRCPTHTDRSPSLSVADGDNGYLLVNCFAGCDARDVLAAIDRLRQDFVSKRNHPPKVAKAPNVQPYISALWGDAIPIEGTSGEAYLHSRGITGKIPDTIGFIDSLVHKPSGTRWSAMVAGVQRYPDKSVVAVHRTYLAKDGKGKAPVEPNKMMLGAVGGGAVRLGSLQPVLVVAEGIETALSIHGAGYTVWAVLSASNFKSLILPPVERVSEIIIAADHDKAGLEAAYKAAELWGSQGRLVCVSVPPQGQDFNDVLRGGL